MDAGEPKAGRTAWAPGRPSHLASLGLGLGLGAVGALPAFLGLVGVPGDEFTLLAWLACIAPAAGALAGAFGLDPWRFGPVAPALWAVALALTGAARAEPGLQGPALGAAAWTGLYFQGFAVGAWSRSAGASASVLLVLSALLVALPGRGGLTGTPWPPRAASALLDASPFVLLGECSGVRDLAWHRSLYAAAGTDRFQRDPWNPPWTAASVLALGVGATWLALRLRRRGAGSESGKRAG